MHIAAVQAAVLAVRQPFGGASCFGTTRRAKVAELVDAPDLGSGADEVWGFESPLSHHEDDPAKLGAA